jgi:hypothetical protein
MRAVNFALTVGAGALVLLAWVAKAALFAWVASVVWGGA